jgi:hypothetical protein
VEMGRLRSMYVLQCMRLSRGTACGNGSAARNLLPAVHEAKQTWRKCGLSVRVHAEMQGVCHGHNHARQLCADHVHDSGAFPSFTVEQSNHRALLRSWLAVEHSLHVLCRTVSAALSSPAAECGVVQCFCAPVGPMLLCCRRSRVLLLDLRSRPANIYMCILSPRSCWDLALVKSI